MAQDTQTTETILSICEEIKQQCKDQDHFPHVEPFLTAVFFLELTKLKLLHLKGSLTERDTLAADLFTEKLIKLQDDQKVLLSEAFYSFALDDNDSGRIEHSETWLSQSLSLLNNVSDSSLYNNQKLKINRFLSLSFLSVSISFQISTSYPPAIRESH